MAQIRGNTQIMPGTITSTQLNSAAAISDGQLAATYLYANGTRNMTGALNMGSQQINSVANGAATTDAVNLGQVQALVEGISNKLSARAATNTESVTIVGGNVTGLTGTSADSVAINVGDPVLIMNAPAASGACGGSTLSQQPANGLYVCTNNTTNLTLARAVDMAGSAGPFGALIYVVNGATWGGGGYAVTTPNTDGAFTYGTGSNIGFTQWNGLGDVAVTGPMTKVGNTISLPTMATGTVLLGSAGTATVGTLSGAITVGSTGVVTLAAAAVALSNLANLAANTVIGNSTGSAATPTAVPLSGAVGGAVSSIPISDANKNLYANAMIEALTTTAMSGGTLTLTAAAGTAFQQFTGTGTTSHTLVMPDATTLPVGIQYFITNRNTGTGTVTVNANGGGALQIMAAGSQLVLTLVAHGAAAGTWDISYLTAGGTGTVTTASVAAANGFAGTVATATTTPVITITTGVAAGLLASNGSGAMQAATTANVLTPSGTTGYMPPSVPYSGTVGAGNVTFGTQYTPVEVGSVTTLKVYVNGELQLVGTDVTGSATTGGGTVVTLAVAPISGDQVLFEYWH
jgi:hypothetical protein